MQRMMPSSRWSHDLALPPPKTQICTPLSFHFKKTKRNKKVDRDIICYSTKVSNKVKTTSQNNINTELSLVTLKILHGYLYRNVRVNKLD